MSNVKNFLTKIRAFVIDLSENTRHDWKNNKNEVVQLCCFFIAAKYKIEIFVLLICDGRIRFNGLLSLECHRYKRVF